MIVTVLGSGTSQGVPVIACECEVCISSDTKDKRLRCSVLIEKNGETWLIDAGPDFRYQMLRANVKNLNGIMLTHEHKDHVAGLDDVRAFNFKNGKDMDIYCSNNVEDALRREFHYVFENSSYPGVPKFKIQIIQNQSFHIESLGEIIPIQVMHYKMPVFGFRIDNFAYVTDAKTIAEEEIEKLFHLDMLIVNCLREEEHISHFNLQEVLKLIERLNPKKTYLTHISHVFGTQIAIEEKLPASVFVAYDGLKLTI